MSKESDKKVTSYTEQYFSGTERLASAIGNGGLADIGNVNGTSLADKLRERDTLLFRVMAPYPLRINRNRLDTLYSLTQPDTTAELTYFFHPDHLGSASWITDLSGQPVQHLQYKPFGGDYIDQQDPNTEYSERFRFTGKERDAETGYDYFGARYYSSSLGIWLSVDPMSDKYPSLSPYVYCADNPMRLVDPKGDTVVIHGNDGNNTIYSKGMNYQGGDPFTIQVVEALNSVVENSPTANNMIGELVASKYSFSIEEQCESYYLPDNMEQYRNEKIIPPDNGTINWNPNGTELWEKCFGSKGKLETNAHLGINPEIDLSHELIHAFDHINNTLYGDREKIKGLYTREWRAVYFENKIRLEMGYPLRSHYRTGLDKNGQKSPALPCLIDSSGKSPYSIKRLTL